MPRNDKAVIPRRILEEFVWSWLLSADCLQKLWIDTCFGNALNPPSWPRRGDGPPDFLRTHKMTISTPGVPERTAAFRGVPRRTRAFWAAQRRGKAKGSLRRRVCFYQIVCLV